MPLVSMRQLLDEAAAGGYGVGAFNVNNMEQVQGIVGAAFTLGARRVGAKAWGVLTGERPPTKR